MPRKIIIDTDPGQDDAVGILLALASPEVEVLALTTVAGNVPLDLTGTTMDGKKWDVASERGTVVVLNVWGAWCPPCQNELPHLQSAWAGWQAAGQPVVMLGINQRDSVQRAQATLATARLNAGRSAELVRIDAVSKQDFDVAKAALQSAQADIDNALFAKAVDRVATISAEKSRSVKLAFDNDRVKLTVRNMEAGQAEEEVEIGYSDQPFEIGFNARYLLDVAGQITGENAAFKFADPASPTLVLDPGDPGVQYVLMPLRV